VRGPASSRRFGQADDREARQAVAEITSTRTALPSVLRTASDRDRLGFSWKAIG
jgi:hypothetical protein